MKRSTIMALIEGHRQRLNEGLIFFKATGDIDRAGDEYKTVEYNELRHKFYDGDIPFDIPAGSFVEQLTEVYKGSVITVGIALQSEKDVFVDEITEYDVHRVVRELIAKEVGKSVGRYVSSYNIDCKLTKLYLSGAIEWTDYVKSVTENC